MSEIPTNISANPISMNKNLIKIERNLTYCMNRSLIHIIRNPMKLYWNLMKINTNPLLKYRNRIKLIGRKPIKMNRNP